jgi:KaiC/GvpD/RAD55 family RecA-like ATPase
MALERVPTGIEGLDRLIGGGLVRGSRTLAYGPPGSGKTVFGMQFAWEGITREEVVSYDSLDRPFAYLRGYFDSFGWKIGPHESQGRLVPVQSFPHYATHQKEPHIIYYNPLSLEEMRTLGAELSRRRVKRLVCGDYTEGFRASLPVQEILDITRWTLAWAFENGITGIDLITGTPGDPEGDRGRAMVEKYVNNVIYLRVRDGQREMKILKMEAADHPLDWLPFNITKDGIVL